MKVIIDATPTPVQKRAKGVTNVLVTLIKGIFNSHSDIEFIIFCRNESLFGHIASTNNMKINIVRFPNKFYWEQIGLPLISKREKPDYILTFSDRISIWDKNRYILYICEDPIKRIRCLWEWHHKLTFNIYDKLVNIYTQLCFQNSLKKAHLIIASCLNTKKELSRYKIKNNDEKIKIVYLACAGCFHQDDKGYAKKYVQQKYGAEDYIFTVASNDPREDLGTAISIYNDFCSKYKSPPRLIIAGNLKGSIFNIKERAKKFNIDKNIIFTGYVEEDDLVKLYQASYLYLDLSLFEGFLPVLEAVSCGIPVIAADTPDIREIIQDRGILLPVRDIKSFSDAIERLFKDKAHYHNLKQKALDIAKEFHSSRMVSEILNILKSLDNPGQNKI